MTNYSANTRNVPLVVLLERAFEGVAIAAPGPWRLVYGNQALGEWLGMHAADLIGRPVGQFVQDPTPSPLETVLDSVSKGERNEAALSASLVISGQAREPVDVRLVRIILDDGPHVGILVEKSAANRSDRPLVPAERRDPLTGLPDRAYLLSRLETLMESKQGADSQFAVLFVDLDNFKHVNDAYGHLVGDDVLREVARRLSQCVRDGDCVVRYGGDEFVVLVERVSGLHEVEPVIRRLHATLRGCFSLANGTVELSASVGSALSSSNCRTAQQLLMAADRDMYASKQGRQQ